MRAYGEALLYGTSPRLVDFSFSKRGIDTRWIAQLTVGNRVAWTNAPNRIAAGLAAGTVTFNKKTAP
ncbi:MAG: hypothetical protein IT566_17055 [Rhodospirillaceae bacterium]|nr:hypothetical protein [Rhodospirillaceae bacterium]